MRLVKNDKKKHTRVLIRHRSSFSIDGWEPALEIATFYNLLKNAPGSIIYTQDYEDFRQAIISHKNQ